MVSETLTMGASLFPATSLFSIARRTDTVNFRHGVHFSTYYCTIQTMHQDNVSIMTRMIQDMVTRFVNYN